MQNRTSRTRSQKLETSTKPISDSTHHINQSVMNSNLSNHSVSEDEESIETESLIYEIEDDENDTTTIENPLDSNIINEIDNINPPITRNCIKNIKMSWRYRVLIASFIIHSAVMGWYVSSRPGNGKWTSPFSWHPFLMTFGMVGSMGMGAITKKLGGYANTKTHGVLSGVGYLMAVFGFVAIYHNKNLLGKAHFQTTHGKVGLSIMVLMMAPLAAGLIALHPDFGVDKTNKTIRMMHKYFARILMALAWGNCMYGVYGMRKEHPLELFAYGLPLMFWMPLTLI